MMFDVIRCKENKEDMAILKAIF